MDDSATGPVSACLECGRLRAALEEAQLQIAQLQADVRELRAQLQRNSSNSSTPPSANPLNAPKPVVKALTGRRRGGQAGHQGHHRLRLPESRVNDVVVYVPPICTGCRMPLPAEAGPHD